MSVLSDRALTDLIFNHDPPLLHPCPVSHVNSASVDICIGLTAQSEKNPYGGALDFIHAVLPRTVPPDVWDPVFDLGGRTKDNPFWLEPGEALLVATLETICLPNGYALDIRLKSTSARWGFDHSLAFWFDPGWRGVGTMEIRNTLQRHALPLWPGMRFAQLVVKTMDAPAAHPYNGRYQDATTVEGPKDMKI